VESPEQQRVQKAFDQARPDREAGDTVIDYLLIPSVVMQWLFPEEVPPLRFATVGTTTFLKARSLRG